MAHENYINSRLLGGVAALALGASLSNTGYAQDSANADNENLFVLETIVVSAERRTQDSQDVPIAVTVLTETDLANKGINSVDDLQRFAPGLSITPVGRSTFVNIRGVGIAQSAPTSVPGVAFYIDGMSIPHEFLIKQSFFDLSSVEVLRGPQGTLTGQNSTGGAVYMTSVAPSYDSSYTKVTAEVGTYDRYKAIIATNLALSENVAIRAAYTHNEQGSYFDNIGSGGEIGYSDLDAARINIAFRSDDDRFTANLRGSYFDNNTGYEPVKLVSDTTDPFTLDQDGPNSLTQEGYWISFEPRWEFTDGIEARAHISYQDSDQYDLADGDRTSTALPIPDGLPASGANRAMYPGRVSYGYNGFKTFLAEVNLLSTGDGPFNWVVGGFYMDDKVDTDLFRDHHNTTEFVNIDSDIQVKPENTSKSVFGQINWFATEQLEVIAGVRYSKDKQVFNKLTQVGPFPPNVGVAKSSEWTGKLGLNYFVNDDMMVFLTASKGYKAGGVNLLPIHDNFEPETNYVYELGFKSELMDKTVRLNGNVYYSDYRDIQLISLNGGLPFTENIAKMQNYGVELEGLAQINRLALNFGISLQNGEFAEDACANNPFGSSALCPGGTDDFINEGDTAPYAPKWTLNAGLEYEFDLGNDHILVPRIQASHTSKQLATPFPGPRSDIESRTILDMRLRYQLPSGTVIEAYADNLFDETYVLSQRGDASSATGGLIYGPPLTVGLRATFEFGH